jgi:hypothetical protein
VGEVRSATLLGGGGMVGRSLSTVSGFQRPQSVGRREAEARRGQARARSAAPVPGQDSRAVSYPSAAPPPNNPGSFDPKGTTRQRPASPARAGPQGSLVSKLTGDRFWCNAI